jgi:hypothetical protein
MGFWTLCPAIEVETPFFQIPVISNRRSLVLGTKGTMISTHILRRSAHKDVVDLASRQPVISIKRELDTFVIVGHSPTYTVHEEIIHTLYIHKHLQFPSNYVNYFICKSKIQLIFYLR